MALFINYMYYIYCDKYNLIYKKKIKPFILILTFNIFNINQ